jgi:transcriptional regulator GlxA family with amidase domain
LANEEFHSEKKMNLDIEKSKYDLPLVVGILIFEDVEVLDVAGPFEVFSETRLNEERRFEEESPFKVILISESLNPVFAMGKLQLIPNHDFDDCPELDLLIVPGGKGSRSQVNNPRLVSWISNQSKKTPLTASICTGSSLIGKAGLLNDRMATTHFRAFDFLRKSAPAAKIQQGVRFTMEKPVFTSAGVASGIDLSLRIVSNYFGTDIGQATARYMEYPYPKNDKPCKGI